MSSSIDYIDCPKCGKIATREQYTTGYVHTHCSICGYEHEFDPEPKDAIEE